MKTIFKAAAFAMCSATAGSAQQLTYGDFSVDFSYLDDGLTDQDLWTLQGAIEYTFGQILLSAQVYDRSRNGNGLDVDSTTYALGAGYMFTPQILGGGGVKGYANTNDSAFDYVGLEVFGQYETAQFGVALNHTRQDLDRDATTTTLYGLIRPMPDLELGARIRTYANSSLAVFDERTYYYLTADYDDGPFALRGAVTGNDAVDGGRFLARGAAEVTPDLRVLASYSTNFGDAGLDLASYSAGAGVQVAPNVWVDTTYGLVSGDAFLRDVTYLSLNISFEFGNRTRIDETFEKDASDDDNAGLGKLAFSFVLP